LGQKGTKVTKLQSFELVRHLYVKTFPKWFLLKIQAEPAGHEKLMPTSFTPLFASMSTTPNPG
jgi:hypothetical protein